MRSRRLQGDAAPRRRRGAAALVVGALAIATAVLTPLPAGADTVVDTIVVDSESTSSSTAVLSPDGSRLYIADADANTVSVVDTSSREIVGTVSVSTPFGVAVSPDGTRLYVVSPTTNTLVVVDTATLAVVATPATGSNPFAVAVSPDGARAYVTNVNGSGTSPLTVVDTATNAVIATPAVPTGQRPLIASPDGSRLYMAGSSPVNHDIRAFDTATQTIVATIAVGVFANTVTGLAISDDGATLYAASANSDTVRLIDTATNTITTTIAAGDGAYGIALTPDGTRAYVTNSNADTVSVIDRSTNAVVSTIPVGANPRTVVISPDGAFAYVANTDADTVSVIAIDTFPAITTTAVADGMVGAAYSAAIAVTGSPGPTLAVTSGSLPPGLSLVGGEITGTPTVPGTYTFTLTASSSVSGIPASDDQAYTLVVDAAVPGAPLDLAAARDASAAVLTWTAPPFDGGSPIIGYRIERSVDGGGFSTLVADTASSDLTYTDATVTAGHTYTYRVSAITDAGVGAPSNVADVVMPAATPTPTPTPTPTASGSATGVLPATGGGGEGTAALLIGLGLLVAGSAALGLDAVRRSRRA